MNSNLTVFTCVAWPHIRDVSNIRPHMKVARVRFEKISYLCRHNSEKNGSVSHIKSDLSLQPANEQSLYQDTHCHLNIKMSLCILIRYFALTLMSMQHVV